MSVKLLQPLAYFNNKGTFKTILIVVQPKIKKYKKVKRSEKEEKQGEDFGKFVT